jgi:hypothetical protein
MVYYSGVVRTVILSKRAKKDLAAVPRHVALRGHRSIRLSRGYRAYYRIMKTSIQFIHVERVDKHVY